MRIRKTVSALLLPHIAVALALVPFSLTFLICSALRYSSDHPIFISACVISAYTLAVWCIRTPATIRFFRRLSSDSRYLSMWRENAELRAKMSLSVSLMINIAYSVFQLGLGVLHASFWYYSMALYYISLVIMRAFLLRYTRKNRPWEDVTAELKRYRSCGIVFLIMNIAVSLMIFFMVYWNRTIVHHRITAIAMAAYSFTHITLIIISSIRHRKDRSPVYAASKMVSLASACVSMLILESTMLTAFGTEDGLSAASRRLFLAISGGAVSVIIIVLAVYMISNATLKIRKLKDSKE